VTAHVTLPAEISLLAADASTTSYLQVLVAADTPPGHPPAGRALHRLRPG
jgi:hypothetical protein